MEWPITSKPWAICNEQSTSRSSSKSLFRNNLRLLSPQLPTSEPSKEIEACIVDAMRVVHIIPINDLRPPTFKFWACRLTCLIPRNTRQAHPFTLSLMTTDLRKDSWLYPKGDQTKRQRERRIANLSQTLPKLGDWNCFLTNDVNKFQSLKVAFMTIMLFYVVSDINTYMWYV